MSHRSLDNEGKWNLAKKSDLSYGFSCSGFVELGIVISKLFADIPRVREIVARGRSQRGHKSVRCLSPCKESQSPPIFVAVSKDRLPLGQ